VAKAAKVDEKALAGKLAALLASRMAAREKDAAREARKTVRKVLDLSKQGASELEIAEEIQAIETSKLVNPSPRNLHIYFKYM